MSVAETSVGAARGERADERGVPAFVRRHRHGLINLYVFVNIAVWVAWRTYHVWAQGQMGYVEVAFAVQNLIFLTLILSRRPPRGLDRQPIHQAVAALAFFSGLAFMGQPVTGGAAARTVSTVVTIVAHLLSILALLNLGRSFGVLIALRTIQTRGVYSVVRHPMYLSDILFRVGFLASHLTGWTAALFIASSACYVYRALLEERFLGQQPEYRAYMARVKYRFIPFVF